MAINLAIVVEVLAFTQIAFNVYVTRRVLASVFYETPQKRVQVLIVWGLPIVGIVLVWVFLQSERPRTSPSEESEDDDVVESVFSDNSAEGASAEQ